MEGQLSGPRTSPLMEQRWMGGWERGDRGGTPELQDSISGGGARGSKGTVMITSKEKNGRKGRRGMSWVCFCLYQTSITRVRNKDIYCKTAYLERPQVVFVELQMKTGSSARDNELTHADYT